MNNTQKKVIVAMSGGVDSSVSAWLLKQQGYQVAGLFMKNWEEDDSDQYCSATQDIADAQQVCDKLGITLHQINFAAEYWDDVFEHFLTEYKAGRTPNPDILCNREIKFKVCLDYAYHLGADYFATGHYAQVIHKGNQTQLCRGMDNNKDQTYFLYALNQKQLINTLFPIGHLQKTKVRELAAEAGLITHNKKDSTGICFIGERKFKEFLNQYIPAQPGVIETTDGKVIGKHDGLMFYTIGQRQGLQIGGLKDGQQLPWYVLCKDLERNVLVVGQGSNHPKLFASQLICGQMNWISEKAPELPYSCTAKIRYRHQDQACTITAVNQLHYQVEFDVPQQAITPGQSIVFYHNELCLGGGIIEKAITE